MEELTPKKLVEILDQWLCGCDDPKKVGGISGGAITDITKALIEPAPDLGVFILGACFIDAMAGFRYGVTRNFDIKSGKRFINFVKEYLPQYDDPEAFYKGLRCGLVHNYVEQRGKYVFLSGDEKFHHGTIETGQIIIHRKSFINELIKAYKKLKNDILDNKEIFDLAKARYESLGLMRCPIVNMYLKNNPDRPGSVQSLN